MLLMTTVVKSRHDYSSIRFAEARKRERGREGENASVEVVGAEQLINGWQNNDGTSADQVGCRFWSMLRKFGRRECKGDAGGIQR
jgi:hypothetical protein